jgi:hypothetical protein
MGPVSTKCPIGVGVAVGVGLGVGVGPAGVGEAVGVWVGDSEDEGAAVAVSGAVADTVVDGLVEAIAAWLSVDVPGLAVYALTPRPKMSASFARSFPALMCPPRDIANARLVIAAPVPRGA